MNMTPDYYEVRQGAGKTTFNFYTAEQYYKAIPGMLRLLKEEREDLEDEYSGLRGMDMDGMPRGTSPGKPVEVLGILAAETDMAARLGQIEAKEKRLRTDQAIIQECLDGLNSKYKNLIVMRYVYGYSWGKISVKLSVPDSTARSWHEKAIKRLGEAMEEQPGCTELLARATRART